MLVRWEQRRLGDFAQRRYFLAVFVPLREGVFGAFCGRLSGLDADDRAGRVSQNFVRRRTPSDDKQIGSELLRGARGILA